MSVRFRVVFLMALLGVSLGASAQVISQLAPGERIPNLDKFKAELKAYHDCTGSYGCYTRDLNLQANRAIMFLKHRAAHARAGEKLALVLDIDETTLSNYPEMVAAGFAYDSARFDAWEKQAKAPAIDGTLRLYKVARQLGVSVFFLTGRPESERAETVQDLHAAGFDDWQELILRSANELHETALAYKSAERARIVSQGYRIVLNVGDQWSDLRGKPMAEFSVKYPDPFYFIP